MGGRKQAARRRFDLNKSSSGKHEKNGTKTFGYDYSKDYSDPKWPYLHGRMDRGAKLLLIIFPLCVISAITYVWYSAHLRDMVRTPLDAPKIISANTSNEDMLWGTYRSNVYFGLKARSPRSPVFGKAMYMGYQ